MKKIIFLTFFLILGAIQMAYAQDVTATVTHETGVDANNGTIMLDITGGFAPYSFVWSGPNGYSNTSQNIINLIPGMYCVTVTDGLCGTLSVCETVIECDAILNVTTSSVCPYTTGNITISMGGPAPYTISWSDGVQQTVKLSASTARENLSPGQYCATVTNANGCSESMCRNVPPFQPIQITGAVVNPACPTLGSITLSVSGGQTPFSYQWSDGAATTQNRANLTPGTYCVTATDAGGCTATKCFTLVQQWSAGSFAEITGVNHNPYNDNSCWYGSIDLTTQGSNAPFTYLWSNGQTTQDLQHLCSGTYTVTVTNALGCTKVLSTIVKNCDQSIAPIVIVNSTITPVSSPGASDGSINLATSGGFCSGFCFIYKWTKQGNGEVIATTQDVFNLPGGTYCVEISGGCGQGISACYTVVDCSINAPPAPTLTFDVVGDNSYNNPPAPGSINLTVQGGTPPFSFNWSTGATTEDIFTTYGTRHVTVTDFCGRTVTGITAVTPCRGFYFQPQDNCTNDPELKFGFRWYLSSNSNEWVNTVMPYRVNSPTFCDKVIHIAWPDGNHSTLNLDESGLVDPDETQNDAWLDYDPDGVWDVPSSLFGYICATISDNCGCRNTYCDFVGQNQDAAGWEWQPVGDVALPLSGQTFPVITRCFECDVCSTPGQVPDMNHMQLIDCSDNTERTTLTYRNNDLGNPCTGGTILCPVLNTNYNVIPGAHGDPIVNWDAEPQYDAATGMCIYPLGCLFSEGTVEGIDGPVYVNNPNGYFVQNVNGLCKPPGSPQDCDGIILQDPNGMDEDCNVALLCYPSNGGDPIQVGFIANWSGCICNGIIIRSCPYWDEPSCNNPNNEILYSGPLPFYEENTFIYPEQYRDFLYSFFLAQGLTPPNGWDQYLFAECDGGRPIHSPRNKIWSQEVEKKTIDSDLIFKISPNPTKEKIYLYSKNMDFTSIKMFNNLGQFVTEIKGMASKNEGLELSLPVDLSSGSYIIQATFRDGSTNQAIFIKID